jgi:predicted GIY-YIG superfamily endonuclease
VAIGTRSEALKAEYAFKQLAASEKWTRAAQMKAPARVRA